MTTEAPRLKEMSRDISKKLRSFGGAWAKHGTLQQDAMNDSNVAPNREEIFAEVVKRVDMAFERRRVQCRAGRTCIVAASAGRRAKGNANIAELLCTARRFGSHLQPL